MTKSQQAVRDLVRVIKDITGNLPPLPGIFPDMMAPVVINAPPDNTREMMMMRWGFPQPDPRPAEKPRGGYVTNVRNTTSAYWKPYLWPEFRCLVPVTSFAEYDHRTRPPTCTWFARNESRPLMFFAGIWRPWNGRRGTKAAPAEGDHLLFSFLTTTPNSVVAPIHEKAMPVLLLDEAQREAWLTGTMDEALKLQRPAPNDAITVVMTGEKEDVVI